MVVRYKNTTKVETWQQEKREAFESSCTMHMKLLITTNATKTCTSTWGTGDRGGGQVKGGQTGPAEETEIWMNRTGLKANTYKAIHSTARVGTYLNKEYVKRKTQTVRQGTESNSHQNKKERKKKKKKINNYTTDSRQASRRESG